MHALVRRKEEKKGPIFERSLALGRSKRRSRGEENVQQADRPRLAKDVIKKGQTEKTRERVWGGGGGGGGGVCWQHSQVTKVSTVSQEHHYTEEEKVLLIRGVAKSMEKERKREEGVRGKKTHRQVGLGETP